MTVASLFPGHRHGVAVTAALVALLLDVPTVASFSQDYDAARIETARVAERLHVLTVAGGDVVVGNMAVSIGEDGVLVVDDQFVELAPKYLEAIRELGGGDIEFAINTHWHFDHADGNKALGPAGAVIVAHENSRAALQHENAINLVDMQIAQPAYSPAALPVVTYGREMTIHFNGERIDLLHFGAAHTTGDTAVLFRGSNAVHAGDVFNNAGYPFIDADNGGSLEGAVSFCRSILAEIDDETTVIPGHGAVSDSKGLANYTAMLATVQERIAALVAEGASLDEVMATRPTAEWDERYGDPTRLIDRAYASLVRD